MSSCVFCRIAGGVEAPGGGGEVEPLGLTTCAFTPLNPVTPGHKLIVPYTHVTDFAHNPAITAAAALEAARYAQAVLGDQDANLITSRGLSATQTVYHLHWHLVPRAPGDGLHLPWTPSP